MAAPVSLTPRPMTSGSVPKMHLPVIEHPRSRMGDHSNLSIQGEMTALGMPGRQQTFVTLAEDGRIHMGLDHHGRSGLPPLGSRSSSAISLLSDGCARNLADRGKYRRPVENTPRVGPNELEVLLSDKITMETHAVKHLFRTNDPNGGGAVTREGLLKILYSLFGYVSNDHYNRLLKRMGLDNKTQITFEDIENYLTYKENQQKAWVSPITQKVEMHPKNVEEHLRSIPEFLSRDKVISASLCHLMLKDRIRHKLQSPGQSVNTLLPEACRDPQSIILLVQLQQLISDLDINVKQVDFNKLWQRYDRDGVGALKKNQFYNVLGLDKEGCSSTVITPRHLIVNSRSKTCIDLKERRSPRKSVAEDLSHAKSDSEEKPYKPAKQLPRTRTAASDNPIHMLHNKFEESYIAMQQGLQCFDLLGDGIITKVDMKRVFDEFGLQLRAMDMDQFLTRIGLKVNRNQIDYKNFLDKYWNKNDFGLVHRIVTTNKHFFLSDGYHGYSDNDLTPEQLEAKLVEFFHKDYYVMTHYLKSADRYKLGVVTRHEFREGIQRVLGYNMSDRHWDSLLNTVGLDNDGLVPYAKFIEQFNLSKPGQWMREGSQSQKSVSGPGAVPGPVPAVERLREHSMDEVRQRQPELDKLSQENSQTISVQLKQKLADNLRNMQHAKHGRSLQDVNNLVRDLCRNRFTAVDNAFKSIDPKMTGRLNKSQFGDILRQCDLELLPLEIERLWNSLDVASDGMLTFSATIQHFKDISKVKHHDTEGSVDNMREEGVALEYHGKYGYAYHNVPTGEDMMLSNANGEMKDCTSTSTRPIRIPSQMTEGSTKANRLTEILTKIQPKVHEHWGHLKQILLHTDRQGQGHILGVDMKDILTTLRLPLTASELQKVLASFDNNRDGSFHYLVFLKHYANNSDPVTGKAWDESLAKEFKIALQQKEGLEDRTFVEIMSRLRSDLNKPPLLKDHKNIQRAFKKADINGDGVLSVSEFKATLKACNIKVTAEDLYHIITEFDVNMDGKISYSEFLSYILF